MPSPRDLDLVGEGRRGVESYLSRWAFVSGDAEVVDGDELDVGAPLLRAARKKLRPMRPNPLMPTRTVIVALVWPPSVSRSARSDVTRGDRARAQQRAASASPSSSGSWARPFGPGDRARTTVAMPTAPVGSAVGLAQHDVGLDAVVAQRAARARRRRSRRSRGAGAAGCRRSTTCAADAGDRVADRGQRERGEHARVQRARAEHDLVGLLDRVDARRAPAVRRPARARPA